MLFSVDFVKDIFPNILGEIRSDLVIHQIMDDSRLKKEKSLFVPIIGEHFNGHHYLMDAIKNGAVGSLWQKDEPIPKDVPTSFVFFKVENTLDALHSLAHAYRISVNPIVIGVTGSNGKTSTKDIIYALLKTKAETHATVGNFNNLIGLPLTILQMKPNTKYLVLEMGMDRFFEIEKLSEIARPDYAIITNIGESHIEFLGSREGITSAKLEIIRGLTTQGKFIYDGDEPLLSNRFVQYTTLACGFNPAHAYYIHEIQLREDGTQFTLNEGERYHIPLIGRHHAKNAAYAIAIAKDLQMNPQEIQSALTKIKMSTMRFEIIHGQKDVTLINDAYNASTTSMQAAINVMKQLYSNKKKVLVLGDMYELGTNSKMYHRRVADVIDTSFQAVYTIGKDANEMTDAIKDIEGVIKKHAKNKNDLIEMIEKHLNDETVILFKASRGMKLEEVIQQLL